MMTTRPRLFLCLVVFWTAAGDSFGQDTKASKRTLSISDPLTPEETKTPVETYVPPEEIAAKAFDPPAGGKRLSKNGVWIDREKHRVYVDGYVAMQDGPMEMFACPAGTKEHESVVATIAKAREVHAALLAVGAMPGTPVSFVPRFVPATGQRIRVWVCYLDKAGKFQVTDARKWVRKIGTDDSMDSDWVFAGSGFWKDPSDGREYYRADSGDMICVSNFSTAMMDVPIASSADADNLQYIPYSDRIPERGTPVRMVLVPIPIPADKPESQQQIDPDQPPTETILKARSQ